MSNQMSNLFVYWVAITMLVAFALASARSAPYGELNQANPEQENVVSGFVDTGLTPLQLEMLAQRLADYGGSSNQLAPQLPAAWDRRSPQAKRQNRYRQCYFNPISCFRK